MVQLAEPSMPENLWLVEYLNYLRRFQPPLLEYQVILRCLNTIYGLSAAR